MSDIIQFCFNLHVNLKIYHWQYLTHINTGNNGIDRGVEKIIECADKFIEAYIEKYNIFKIDKKNENIKLINLNDSDMSEYIKNAKKFIHTNIYIKLNKNEDPELLNIIDELLESLNNTTYLLTLNY